MLTTGRVRDYAETMLAWYAFRYRSWTMTPWQRRLIRRDDSEPARVARPLRVRMVLTTTMRLMTMALIMFLAAPVAAEPQFGAGVAEALPETFTSPPDDFRPGGSDWHSECKAIWPPERANRVIDHEWRDEAPVFLYKGFCGSTAFEVWADVAIGKDVADREVLAMVDAISALPAVLHRNFRILRIMPGSRQPTFSVNHHGVIDTSPRARRIFAVDRILDEAFFHEFAHWQGFRYQYHGGWRAAQRRDGEFISAYAAQHPGREDYAETLLAWYALRYRPWTMAPATRRVIRETIPNRLAWLDRCASGWC